MIENNKVIDENKWHLFINRKINTTNDSLFNNNNNKKNIVNNSTLKCQKFTSIIKSNLNYYSSHLVLLLILSSCSLIQAKQQAPTNNIGNLFNHNFLSYIIYL